MPYKDPEQHKANGAKWRRELDFRMGRGFKDRTASPSLDRFDNSKGYTVENVVIICWRCNVVKGHGLVAELEVVLAYIVRELG